MIISASDFYKWVEIFNLQEGSTPPAGLIPGDGISYDAFTGVISADINTTNLQFTTSQINTIQDIDTTASPTFGGMTVNLNTSTPFSINSTTAGFLMPRMSSVDFDSIPSPDNALIAWATDLDRFRVNKGTAGAPVYDTLAYLSDIAAVTADGAIGECYFNNNSTETVIASISTPVQVNGTYVTGELVNITHVNGRLTNAGSETLVLKVSASMTCSLNLTTADIKAYIYKNGSVSSNFTQEPSLDGTSPSFHTVALTGFITLSPNDYIEVYISNETNTDNITVQSLNFNCNTVGAAIQTVDTVRQLGSCLVANTAYTFGNYSSVIDVFQGQQSILAGTFPIGSTVEVSMNFDIVPTPTVTSSIGGTFNYIFGGTTIAVPVGVNEIILTNNAPRTGQLTYTITRIDINTVLITLMGSYTKTDITYTSLYANPTIFSSSTYAYNDSLDYLLDIEFKPQVGSPTEYLSIIARNLRIVQY